MRTSRVTSRCYERSQYRCAEGSKSSSERGRSLIEGQGIRHWSQVIQLHPGPRWGAYGAPRLVPAPLFSIVSFDYASVNYSILLWLSDVERTMWGCG